MAEEIRPVLMWCSKNPNDVVRVYENREIESSSSCKFKEETILESTVEHSVPVVQRQTPKQFIQDSYHFEPSSSTQETHCQDMTDKVKQEKVDYGYGNIDVDIKPDPDCIVPDDIVHDAQKSKGECSLIAEVVSSQASVENGSSLWQDVSATAQEAQTNMYLRMFERNTDHGLETVTEEDIGDGNRVSENSEEQCDAENEKLFLNRSEQKLKHKCPVCNRQFSLLSRIKRHMVSHTDERPHECTICHKKFKVICDMKIHMKVLHTNALNFNYKCTVCNKQFRWSSSFSRHKLTHKTCTFCHLTFKTSWDLSNHIKLHHDIHSKWAEADNDNEIKAEVYISDDNHLSDNSEEREGVVTKYLLSDAENEKLSFNRSEHHKCTVCNKQFSQTTNYKRHMSIHTAERLHTICHRASESVKSMKMHLKTRKKIGCGKSLRLIDKDIEDCMNKKCYVLLSRIESSHTQHLNKVEKRTDDDRVNRKELISCSVVDNDNPRGDNCGSGTPLKTKPANKACKCCICNKLFNSPGNLRHHLVTHTDQKLCRCNGCNKQFNSIIKLNRHMMINHVKLKPLKCSVCGKVFKSSLCLKSHMKRHAKELNVKSTKDECHKETEEECGDISDPQIQVFNNRLKRLDTNNTLSSTCRQRGKGTAKRTPKRVQINDKHKEIEVVIKNFDGKLQFMCSFCGKPFSRLFGVRRHIASHNPEDPFECTLCDRTFKVVYDLNKHMKCHEPLDPNSKPPVTPMREMNCEKDRHIERETPLKEDLDLPNHGMLMCNKSHENLEFMMPPDSQSGQNGGFTETEDVDLPDSQVCEDKQEINNANKIMSQGGANDNGDIDEEISMYRIYDGTQHFKCSKCLKIFPTLNGLKRHIASHNSEKPFKCTSCDMCFKLAYNFNKHKKLHDRNVEANDMPSNGQSGQKDGFTETEDVDVPDSLVPAYANNQDKNNASRSLSQVGIKDSYDNVNRQKIKIVSSVIDGKRRLFMCSMCGKKFSKAFSARRHIVLHYPERPYKCTFCAKDFKVVYDLNKHMKVHPEFDHASKLVCHASSLDAFDKHKHTLKAQPEPPIQQISTSSKAPPERSIISFVKEEDRHSELGGKDSPRFEILRHEHDMLELDANNGLSKCQEDDIDEELFNGDDDELESIEKSGEKLTSVKCLYCGKSFCSISNLHRHMLMHSSNATPYSCTQCGKTFEFFYDLNKHLEKHSQDNLNMSGVKNDKKSGLLCSICGKVFPRKFSLIRHMASHSVERPHQCRICKKSFRVIYNLNTHMRLNHEDTEFSCHMCHKLYPSLQLLKKHKKTHAKNNRPLCKEKIELTCDMGKHMETRAEITRNSHNQKSGLVCSFCGKEFQRVFNLRRHMASHSLGKPYQCHICQKSFGVIYNLYAHLRRRHGNMKFSCHVCQQTFPSVCGLKKHQKTHELYNENFECNSFINHHMETHAEMTGNCDEQSERRFLCSICGLTFQSSFSLTRHSLSHSSIVEEKRCFVCGLTFGEKYELKKHMKDHDNDNEISIEDEELNSLTEGKSGSNDKAYKCCICDNKFQGRNNLLKHSSTHYDLDRLMCMDCDKRESDESSLERHYLMIHVRIVPFRCAVCSKTFQSQQEFKVHLKVHKALNEHIKLDSTNTSPFSSGLKFANEEIENKKMANLVECDENVERDDHLLLESKLLFKCCLCIYDNGLTGKSDLRKHMSIHCDYETLGCKGCGKKSSCRSNLQRHAMMAHSKMVSVNCSLCFELLETVTDYELHMKSHETVESTVADASSSHVDLDSIDEAPSLHGSKPVNLMDGEGGPNYTEFDRVRESDKDNMKESNPAMDSQPYECCICKDDNRFEGKMSVRNHMSCHCDLEMLRCLECGKRATIKSNLKRHMMTAHVRIYADAQMLNELELDGLESPEIVLTKEYSSVCPIETGSDNIVYKCLICNDGNHFVGKNKVRKHVSTHSDFENLKCQGCSHILSKKSNVMRHMMEVHVKTVPLKCSECLKVVKSITDLRIHMKVHESLNGLRYNVNCNGPSSSSSSSHRDASVKDFDRADANREVSSDPTVVVALPNLCDSERVNVNDDNAMTEELESDEIDDVKVDDSENLLFTCCVCNNEERLKGKKQLSRHMSIHCDLDQEKCMKCNKRWRSRSNLKRHMVVVHAKMFEVKCVLCCEILENIPAFENHMRIHKAQELENNPVTDNQLYECCICKNDNRFEGKMNIRNHMSTHCNYEMLSCIKCGYRATYKSNLKRHMLNHVTTVPPGVKKLNQKEMDKYREGGDLTLDGDRENGNVPLHIDR